MSIYASVTGMVTKEGGLPALDARRERMGWTRTLVRVSVETGEVQRGPLPGEEIVVPEPVQMAEKPKRDRAEFVRLLCDEGLPQNVAAVRSGFAPKSCSWLVSWAIRSGLIVRVGMGKYKRAEGGKGA